MKSIVTQKADGGSRVTLIYESEGEMRAVACGVYNTQVFKVKAPSSKDILREKMKEKNQWESR
jgi:hypothetical protein